VILPLKIQINSKKPGFGRKNQLRTWQHLNNVVTIKQAEKDVKWALKIVKIYILLFKTMTFMASWSFFIHMNVKKFKPKISLVKF
jgi:hypothetical protein